MKDLSRNGIVDQLTVVDDFRQAMEMAGVPPPLEIIEDREIHRFSTNGDLSDTAGWYRYFPDGVPAGVFGCHRSGIRGKWCAKSENPFTGEERAQYHERIAAAQRQRIEDKQRRHSEAAAQAQSIWDQAQPAPGNHPYLVLKGVKSHGLRIHSDGRLIVPIYRDGVLSSLQLIDDHSEKRYLKDGEKQGGTFTIGENPRAPHQLQAEGYATSATLFEVSGLPVTVSFDAGNMLATARTLRSKHPTATILICGDHDKNGTGQRAAEEAAKAVGGGTVTPTDEGDDWNDVFLRHGAEAVRKAIQETLSATTSGMSGSDSAHMPENGQAASFTMSGPESESWPEIQPVKDDLLPVEPLPLDIVPNPLRVWIGDVADRMQCPPDFMAAAALAMVASIVGAGASIRPKRHDDWTVVPNLWGGVVGRPSMLKTPAIAEAMKPLDGLERKAKLTYDEEDRRFSAEREVFEARREALRTDMRKAANGKAKAGSDMESLKYDFAHLEEPSSPVWRRYKTNDATIEKMCELQRDNHRGLLLFRDELTGLFSTWDRDGHESDRAFYLESWNGDRPYTSDRIGRGTTYTDNLCVSIFGGIQPSKLTSYLRQSLRGSNNDGLIQRLQLFVYPDEPRTWTLVDTPINRSAREAAYQVIERLATMDFRQYGAFGEEGRRIPYYRFDEDAQLIFNEWLTELENKLRRDTDEPVLLEHLGKYRSLMPALALLFHLISLAGGQPGGQVSRESAERAAAWCDYLESHARRIYGLVTNLTAQAASRLAIKIQQGDLPSAFTIRDIYRKDWALLDDRQVIENACDELVSLGWLKTRITPPAFSQKGKTEYLINPKVRLL